MSESDKGPQVDTVDTSQKELEPLIYSPFSIPAAFATPSTISIFTSDRRGSGRFKQGQRRCFYIPVLSCFVQSAYHWFAQFRLQLSCIRQSQMLINRFGLNNRIVMDPMDMQNWTIIAIWALKRYGARLSSFLTPFSFSLSLSLLVSCCFQ